MYVVVLMESGVGAWQEFRAAPGGKVRPVVKGDAGIQMSCTSDSLWKPAFCANP